MERKKRKIVRFNSEELPLERRVYESLKNSEFNEDDWNSHGRHYKIRGLYNLSRTNGLILLFGNGIREDLEIYRIQREKRLVQKSDAGIVSKLI